MTQPVAGLQESVVHRLWSSQEMAPPLRQAPSPQVSPEVQALPSSQGTLLLVWAQPVAGAQLSVVQRLWSSQSTAEAGLQAPSPQVSPLVQALPSSQASVLLAKTQPVAGSQLSLVQGLASSQARVSPLTQAPTSQVSPLVQALPSSQVRVLFVKTQPEAGSQLSVVQGLASSQARGPPPWQLPSPQVSPSVQASPSLQGT